MYTSKSIFVLKRFQWSEHQSSHHFTNEQHFGDKAEMDKIKVKTEQLQW